MAGELEPDANAVATALGLNAQQKKELLASISTAISLKRLADRLDQAGETLQRGIAKARIV